VGRYGIIVILLLFMPPIGMANESMEYKLKALYILRLADFITWPETPNKKNFTICIDLSDPIAEQLQKIELPIIKTLSVAVIDLPKKQNVQQCHIIYLAKESLSLAFTNSPVLTLSSDLGFAEQGGMIGFYLEGGKVKMKANLLAANKVSIQFSSKLIRLMQLVKSVGEK